MRICRAVVSILAILLSTVTLGSGQTENAYRRAEGIEKLFNVSGGTAQVSLDPVTGAARFVRVAPGTLSSARSLTVAPAQERGTAFFREYGSIFGVTRTDIELRAVGTVRDVHGIEHAIFSQTYNGLPVFGGELRAHFNSNGQLFAANGNFVSGIKLDITPTLTAEEAAGRAIRTVIAQQARKHRASGVADGGASVFNDDDYDDLTAAATTLTVFRTGLVQGVPGRNHLAYEVKVLNQSRTIREFVFVDAHSGAVIDQITGIHDGLDRRAYDAMGLTAPGPNYPGSPFWAEGQVPFPTGNVEADNMVVASGETYDLFFNAFDRDSFDGAGATMDAIFNRGDGCPNASWNGTFISFCPGLTTDDVTAHEWAHAYTEFTNNLIYQWQPGALNESYSDIWGETVDLINGRGLDAPDGPRSSCSDGSLRWLMGEESSLGAIRDMWDPTCYGDPGKVTDAEYFCGTEDQGGVHSNSGVPNHAYALMVDGGYYNGYTVKGLGLTKAAHIHWEAQNILTLTSTFADHADALDAACSNLIGNNLNDLGTGLPSGEMINAADCAEVSSISAAVEFRTPPTQCGFGPLLEPDAPALCEGVGKLQTAFFEDFEGGSLPAGWTASFHDVVNPGTFDSPGWSVVGSLPSVASSSFAAFAPDPIIGDCAADTEAGAVALDSPAIVLPAGEVPHVAFDHWAATEAGWDGGNLKVSVNGAPYVVVPSTAYTFNPYNDTIFGPPNDNPLAGEEGFTGTDGGSVGGSWGQSQVDLLWVAAPGDTVQLRFDFGTDGCNGLFGWYVDEVHVYTCSHEEFPICGDGILDAGQACDDGNTNDGDGCSSICQVEDSWICSDPVPPNPDGTNVVADGSFEGGVPNADWTASSTFGGIAGFPLCGPGNGCPAAGLARTGSWLVWIGGLTSSVTSSVEQSVTIPAAATDLTLYTWRGICDDPSDTLHVSLDGTDIGTVPCDGVDGGWVEQSFSVAPFNDGGSHTLVIGGTVGGTNGAQSNFFVDDVVLIDSNAPTPATPSACTQIVEDLACNAGPVEYTGGIAPSWTVIDNEGTGVIWTDIATAFAGGAGPGANFTGGTGEAASVSSDARPFIEFDTELISNSFDLSNTVSATLDYLVNYQNLAFLDFLDVDISTDGGSTWTTLLSWNEDHGGFFAAPGEAPSIDLAAYLGEPDVQIRWHYYDPNYGDWDWYAQVDNVALNCAFTPPRTLKEESVELLEGIDYAGDDKDSDDDSNGIAKAIRKIKKSLRPEYWVDDHHLDSRKGTLVFNAARAAARNLKSQLGDGNDDIVVALSPEDAATVVRVLDKLIRADDQLAQIALDEAIAAADAAGCDSNAKARRKIARAESVLADARSSAAAGGYEKAIASYKQAWRHAQQAIDNVARCRP